MVVVSNDSGFGREIPRLVEKHHDHGPHHHDGADNGGEHAVPCAECRNVVAASCQIAKIRIFPPVLLSSHVNTIAPAKSPMAQPSALEIVEA
jgi:hypothetical protein